MDLIARTANGDKRISFEQYWIGKTETIKPLLLIITNPDTDTYQKVVEIYDIRLSKRFNTVMYIYWEKPDNKQDGRSY